MKAIEARELLKEVPDDWEVSLKIRDTKVSGYEKPQQQNTGQHSYVGPYGNGVSQQDR